MLNGELLRVAWRAISAHKLRSFLTLLGVIIGVMTVVAVVSVIQGLNNYVATKLFSLSPTSTRSSASASSRPGTGSSKPSSGSGFRRATSRCSSASRRPRSWSAPARGRAAP
ncbi:MAG: ABC transporter permease [Holophagales bacterium]|nr:ABC transporter permease [Holophagales bacterium]